MYFNLPKSSERQLAKKESSSSILSTDSTTATAKNNSLMAEDRISEIIHNLDDHWGSPPLLTPDTLAHILNHQWISSEDEQDFRKKANSSKMNISRKDLKLLASSSSKDGNNDNDNQKVITNLITELCKTIQVIDTENKFEVTNEIKNDPIIQKFILSKGKLQDGQSEDVVLEHLVELLRQHNSLT